jgi:hypothetical protein
VELRVLTEENGFDDDREEPMEGAELGIDVLVTEAAPVPVVAA